MNFSKCCLRITCSRNGDDFAPKKTFQYLQTSVSPWESSHKKQQTFLSPSSSNNCRKSFLRSPTTPTLLTRNRRSTPHNSGRSLGPFSRALLSDRPPSDFAEASCTLLNLVVSRPSSLHLDVEGMTGECSLLVTVQCGPLQGVSSIDDHMLSIPRASFFSPFGKALSR